MTAANEDEALANAAANLDERESLFRELSTAKETSPGHYKVTYEIYSGEILVRTPKTVKKIY